MDLKKFDSITNAEAGVELVLEPKTDKGLGAAIVFYGADSSAYKMVEREQMRKNREKKAPLEPEDIAEQVIERLAACTKGWRGLEEGGKTLEFSNTAARKLYRDYPEIADRASGFIFDRRNFFPTASET